ncbi:hypothetical protein [Serpentinimonas maccroryi]|uniref:hypothetical protein n=1 Tax=Serpentinimonas maccroryi TaxID=1458426 RepID=UPI00203356D9|nr:hypothetical protein [Serpentinimonas maccroryi]MCM2479046.1 hypothetical protein [Serpentinimonas maccroryi]
MDLDHSSADRAAPAATRTRWAALQRALLGWAGLGLVGWGLLGSALAAQPPAAAIGSTAPAVAASSASAASATAAGAVRCHIAFAGATRSFTIAPTAHTTAPEPLLHGASFVLEVLNRLPPEPGAGFKVRTFGTWGGQSVLLHQAWYLHTAATGAHGFTGLQVVREPVRGHELAYWCERA